MARSAQAHRAPLPADRAAPSQAIVLAEGTVPLAIGYALRRWEIPQGTAMPAQVEIYESFGHPAHYRIHPIKDYAEGHYEFCGLGGGFFVHVSDIKYPGAYRVSVSAPDMFRVRIASSGDCHYSAAVEDGDGLRLKGPSVAVIVEPAGRPAAEAVFDEHTVAASIYIHRSTLKRLYTDREHELPAVVQTFISGTLDRTVARQLPLGPALLRCLEDLVGCDLDGHGRRLFIRSKAVEILCHAFKALGQDHGLAPSDASLPTRRGVLKAQQLLAANFVTPPSLDDLAHAVGLSRSGLCSGFRQIVGLTVFDYIAELRMRQALTLLVQRDASITQIAYEVGYSHPSSFSLAVQRRFGSTPSELRRRSLPGI